LAKPISFKSLSILHKAPAFESEEGRQGEQEQHESAAAAPPRKGGG
jgi:hypothetical protein